MLRNVTDLQGYAIHATDGVLGHVHDFYFDDEDWAIRYLVVDTGSWLSGRQVLISPLAIGEPDWTSRLLPVSLTKAQVEHSPDIDTRMPVSRQHEVQYVGYYGYPCYWSGAGLWGMGAYPGGLSVDRGFKEDLGARQSSASHERDDSHLRSCQAVIGYHIHATDGDIGHLKDLLVDDGTWAIRYLVVNTSNWWGGHDVLIAPPWIEAVSWLDAKVSVELSRQSVRDAPPYESTAQLNRQQEQGIYDHYGRPGYWTTTSDRDAPALSAE